MESTLIQIVELFELRVDPINTETVKKELRQKMADLHPDRNGGNFLSKEDEENYYKLKNAYDGLGNESLIPIGNEEILHELQALRGSLELVLVAQRLEFEAASKPQTKEDIKKEALGKYTPKKRGSAISASICLGIITLSKILDEFKIFPLNHVLTWVLGILFCFSGFSYIIFWLREEQAAWFTDWLTSEHGLNKILYYQFLLHNKLSTPDQHPNHQDYLNQRNSGYVLPGWAENIQPRLVEKSIST